MVRSSADRGPDGLDVESKGLSPTLHHRRHPEVAEEGGAWARDQAARPGPEGRAAKMSGELHPPNEAGKGTPVEAPAEEAWAALTDWTRQGEWVVGTTVAGAGGEFGDAGFGVESATGGVGEAFVEEG